MCVLCMGLRVFIILSFILMEVSLPIFILARRKTRYYVLFTFSDNLFDLSHVFSKHNSKFTDLIRLFRSLPVIMTLASSAYIMVYNNSEILHI